MSPIAIDALLDVMRSLPPPPLFNAIRLGSTRFLPDRIKPEPCRAALLCSVVSGSVWWVLS